MQTDVVAAQVACDVGDLPHLGAVGAAGPLARDVEIVASIYARLTAAAAYGEAGLPDRRRAMLEGARRDVERLEPSIGQPNPAWMVWQYYHDAGEPDRALEVARRSLDRSGGGPIAALGCVTSLYPRGEFAEALACLDRTPPEDFISGVTRVLVLAGLPDGNRRAPEEFDRLAIRFPEEVASRTEAACSLPASCHLEVKRAFLKEHPEPSREHFDIRMESEDQHLHWHQQLTNVPVSTPACGTKVLILIRSPGLNARRRVRR